MHNCLNILLKRQNLRCLQYHSSQTSNLCHSVSFFTNNKYLLPPILSCFHYPAFTIFSMQNFLNILFKHQISATSSAILLKHQISNASSVITRSLFIAQHLHPHRRTDHTQLFSERLFVRVIFLINVHNDLVISA